MSAAVQEAIELIRVLPETDVIDLVEIMKKRKAEAELIKRRNAFKKIEMIIAKYDLENIDDPKEEYHKYLEERYADPD
ncbi:MAG: hypothetical protein K6G81_10885 [Lachnospiraceae bacterium]|nr:hypothetical protein [Lachnospiraceae bacterium]